MKVKICGLKRQEDVAYVNRYQPDYVGFILNFPKSHRHISYELLQQLSPQVDSSIKKVGVFVDEQTDKMVELVEKGQLDIIQLHGQQDEAFIQQIRSLTSCPIWQAFSIRTAADLERAEASSADGLILDHAGGGSGQTFDWSLIQNFSRPYFLAGGMNAETIPQALKQLKPEGIDLSSGVETQGLKDPEKIKKIVEMVHDA